MPLSNLNKDGVLNALYLVERPKGNRTSDLTHMAQEHGLVHIVGCTREVVFGLGEPPADMEGSITHRGKDAYQRLLAYNSGLLSRTPGEEQIVGQFKEAFRVQQESPVQSLQDYSKLYDWLAADNRAIRSKITHDLQSAYFETVAQRMPARAPKSSVVVVIDEDARGKLSETTLNLIRQLGSYAHNKPTTITLTSYDPRVLGRHTYEIKMMAERGTLQAKIEVAPMDEFLSAPLESELYRRSGYVYVCPKAGKYPEAEAKLVAWQDEAAAFGTEMVLLGGNKSDRKTDGVWAGEHFNLITPEQITAAQKDKKAENAGIIAKGMEAAANCAISRDKGKKPLYGSLGLPAEDYERLHGNSQGRRI